MTDWELNERVLTVLRGLACAAIGGILVWVYGGEPVAACQAGAEQERLGRQIAHATTAVQLQVAWQEHAADRIRWEVRSMQERAETVKAQQELGVALAAAHQWTDAEGRSKLDLPPLTRWQLLERMAVDAGRRVAVGLTLAR